MTPFDSSVPQEWRPIEGYPDYLICEDGTVKRITFNSRGRFKDQIMFQTFSTKYEYRLVALTAPSGKRKAYLVHVLVAKAFIGPQPTPIHEVAHNDGKASHNHWKNLRWATREENAADRLIHGTHVQGEKNPAAVLTADTVREIKSRLDAGEYGTKLAREYGMSFSTIYRIRSGANWKSVLA